MECVAIDVLGPLPETEQGNKYILIAMDYFSKWPEAYALPNQEAIAVTDVLVSQFFSRFGVPSELPSDQGWNFKSSVFQEARTLLGIHNTRTTALIHSLTPWWSATTGLYIEAQLATFVQDHQRLGSTSTSTTYVLLFSSAWNHKVYSCNAHVWTGIACTLGPANWAPTRRTWG